MKKIAIIVQQYGQEMYGGAELHCMRLAEELNTLYDVEVLTTCSIDFLTWADHYRAGKTSINNVKVRRFKVSQLRNWEEMHKLEKRVKIKNNGIKEKKGIKWFFKKLLLHNQNRAGKEDYINWVLAQGPTTPDLISYIKKHEKDYDCLIFFTYLYYPAVLGIGISPAKTIFIPLAHDEWAIYMPVFEPMFNSPACIMYNTMAEKRLVNRIFKNESVYSEIAGTWVDIPEDISEYDVKAEMKINCDYILYVGRIDDFKIPKQDFEWVLKYLQKTKKKLKFVLIGNSYIRIPESEYIMHLGFVDKVTKFNLIKQSVFLFQPSRFESLSMVLLEAFSMGKPVLVHQDCEVMKDHVDQSGGGYYYNDYAGFKHAFDQLSGNESLNRSMGQFGKRYVDENYSCEKIIARFCDVIENRIGKTNR